MTAAEELTHDARALRMATFRLARRLRAERAVDTMTDGQFAVLIALVNDGPHTLSELADRERITPPSMNRTVNCLEESGYLARTQDADDRRKVNISITDEGAEIVAETVRRRAAWLESVLQELTPDDRRVLARAAVLMEEAATR